MEKEYAKQSLLVLMLGLALFMGFTVGYHYNKIVTNIINQKNIKTPDNTSVAINEKNQLLLINKQTGEQTQRPIKPHETVWVRYEEIFTDNYKIISH